MKERTARRPTLVLLVLGQRKRSGAVELQVGISRIEYGVYRRLHCFGRGEYVASQAS